MNTGEIYAVVAFVSMFQLLLAYNRSKTTKYKETVDAYFCKTLLFFAAFCSVDFCWGICDAGYEWVTPGLFTAVAYGYHSMCALSAFIWFGYMLNYMDLQEKTKKHLEIVRHMLIFIQISMIVLNSFNKEGFYVTEDMVYHMGKMRIFMYQVQFLYYIVITVFASIYGAFQRDKKKYNHVCLFSLVPLLFGIGQFLFYDVALYSMGFMVSAFIIYAFNVTEMRENYLTQRADDLNTYANIDALTGLYNRRAYEDDIASKPAYLEQNDFVYVSVDINGLKQANDNIGHEAGDELIKGAAQCMKTCFGGYGKVYRTGGDEFSILFSADETKLNHIQEDFEETVGKWSGTMVKELAVSCGYATRKEFPELNVLDISKKAEERMYKAKANYYLQKGIDRRGRQEAHLALCALYTRIMKINLEDGKYQIINSDSQDSKNNEHDVPDNIFVWLHDFCTSGYVHPEDSQRFLEVTQKEYMKEYFKKGNNSLQILYRRKHDDVFKKAMMELIPSGDYTNENQTLYLYVKELE